MVSWRSAGLVCVVVSVLGLIVLIGPAQEVRPQHTSDTSCHNPFVEGVRRVSAIFEVDLQIANEDWGELARLLEDFASSHEWSFRDTSRTEPGVLMTLYLSLCAENRLRILIAEQRWASQDYAPVPPERGVLLLFYGNMPAGVWHPVAAEIVGTLEKNWPGRVRFRDREGRFVDRPDFLDDPRGRIE